MTEAEEIALMKAEREKFEELLPSLEVAYKGYMVVLIDIAHRKAGGPPHEFVVKSAVKTATMFAARERTVGDKVRMWIITYEAKIRSQLWFWFGRQLDAYLKAGLSYDSDKVVNSSALLGELKKCSEARYFEAHNT